jgi:hypothetical protein
MLYAVVYLPKVFIRVAAGTFRDDGTHGAERLCLYKLS